MTTEKQTAEKHGEISWVNDYGNKGVFISLNKPHNPIGDYDVADGKNIIYVSKTSETGKHRFVEIQRHSSTPFGGGNTTYFENWYVRGNQANGNITATELTKEQALNLAYKIIDTIISDDKICQITEID